MITHGESKIEKIVCIMSNGVVGGSPCGACRELIMQLDKDSKNIEILINKDTYEIKKWKNLFPIGGVNQDLKTINYLKGSDKNGQSTKFDKYKLVYTDSWKTSYKGLPIKDLSWIFFTFYKRKLINI